MNAPAFLADDDGPYPPLTGSGLVVPPPAPSGLDRFAVRRPVGVAGRLVDALSPSERSRALEALLRDPRPAVAMAAAEAVAAQRVRR